MKNIIVVVVATVLFGSVLPAGATDPLLNILEKIPPGRDKPEAGPQIPCPKGRECVLIATFTRPSYKAEAVRYDLSPYTAARGWDRVVVLQRIVEEHGVIINTVKVKAGGNWTPYSQGMRLPEGRTELAVPIPAGAGELVLSLDHGRGAEVRVVLERETVSPRR